MLIIAAILSFLGLGFLIENPDKEPKIDKNTSELTWQEESGDKQ